VLAFAAAAFQLDQFRTHGIGHLLELRLAQMVGVYFQVNTGHSRYPKAGRFGAIFNFLPFTIENLSAHVDFPLMWLNSDLVSSNGKTEKRMCKELEK
jgi:hypothetical protein